MQKQKLNTRKHLQRARAAVAAERRAEEPRPVHLSRRWREQDKEMAKMLKGVEW